MTITKATAMKMLARPLDKYVCRGPRRTPYLYQVSAGTARSGGLSRGWSRRFLIHFGLPVSRVPRITEAYLIRRPDVVPRLQRQCAPCFTHVIKSGLYTISRIAFCLSVFFICYLWTATSLGSHARRVFLKSSTPNKPIVKPNFKTKIVRLRQMAFGCLERNKYDKRQIHKRQVTTHLHKSICVLNMKNYIEIIHITLAVYLWRICLRRSRVVSKTIRSHHDTAHHNRTILPPRANHDVFLLNHTLPRWLSAAFFYV